MCQCFFILYTIVILIETISALELCISKTIWNWKQLSLWQCFISRFWAFFTEQKVANFFSFGSHSLLRLHIFLTGLYSYEQQLGEATQAKRHLKSKTIFWAVRFCLHLVSTETFLMTLFCPHRFCLTSIFFENFGISWICLDIICVGYTAWAPKGSEGRS